MGSLSRYKRWIGKMISSLLPQIDPAVLLKEKISFRHGLLEWDGGRYRFGPGRPIHSQFPSCYVIGAGKGSARMAVALEEVLGDGVTDGIVVTRYGNPFHCKTIRTMEAGHPFPDEAGMRGAQEVLTLARRADKGDLVIGLWSGGGSALLPLPVPGVSLRAKQEVTEHLLKSGATISEINTVRKHLSQIKGGNLARTVSPTRMVNFILSDVVGDSLDVIASGPTVPDPSCFSDAVEIMKRYDIWSSVDRSIRTALLRGVRRIRNETPKRGAAYWHRIQNIIIGNGGLAVEAAVHSVAETGFRPKILTTTLEGEAREVARVMVSLAKEEMRRRRRNDQPVCLLAGGETTVTVRGKGKGGRCQEFALSAALSISGMKRVRVAAFSTDGIDGPTDAAGAVSDGSTLSRATRRGMDARRHLDENNAYPLFQAVGDLIHTGPTCTNLNDLYFVFIGSRTIV
ncbi:MAG: glycerate kinase [Nitrospiria bacterium]